MARLTTGDLAQPRAGQQAPSAGDVKRYRQIFALQQDGRFEEADQLIGRLGNRILLGHVLAQRYLHPTAYVSSFEELRAWLADHADHPQAHRIHRLALQRMPRGATPPVEPVPGYLNGAGQEIAEPLAPAYRTKRRRTPMQEAELEAWRAGIDELLAEGEVERAVNRLERHRGRLLADPTERDLERWRVARRLLAAGHAREAHELAATAARSSGGIAPGMHWTAGLAAWRLGEHARAAEHFQAKADSKAVADARRAGAAFWAARAHRAAGRPQLGEQLLRQAASLDHDFYGLLARAALGEAPGFRFEPERLDRRRLELLLGFDGVRRAMALAQVGRPEDAEREIRKLAARARPDLLAALIALAESLDLPAAQLRLAVHLAIADGRRHHAALFPLPSWTPAGGFSLDRALIYALMRAESGFDPGAESHAGAHGLMQLMPATAAEVAGQLELDLPGPKALFDPHTSIALGEAHLARLLETETVAGGLIEAAAAYNAGLSRVARWKQELDHDDALLFIETLPLAETRAHVKKVLGNLWWYRARLGQELPSLEALALGRWPVYVGLDAQVQHHARR